MPIGAHHSPVAQRDEWLTPPYIVEALGPFDTDPCAAVNQPWQTAAKQYTVDDDGLSKKWGGRVWLNPPYGPKTEIWIGRMSVHGNGIALIFARTETAIFFPWIWERASALLFLKGRLHFHYIDGSRAKNNSGGPSVLVAYGANNVEHLRASQLPGKLILL